MSDQTPDIDALLAVPDDQLDSPAAIDALLALPDDQLDAPASPLSMVPPAQYEGVAHLPYGGPSILEDPEAPLTAQLKQAPPSPLKPQAAWVFAPDAASGTPKDYVSAPPFLTPDQLLVAREAHRIAGATARRSDKVRELALKLNLPSAQVDERLDEYLETDLKQTDLQAWARANPDLARILFQHPELANARLVAEPKPELVKKLKAAGSLVDELKGEAAGWLWSKSPRLALGLSGVVPSLLGDNPLAKLDDKDRLVTKLDSPEAQAINRLGTAEGARENTFMSARPPTSVVGFLGGPAWDKRWEEENRGLRISELGYEEGKAILMGDTEAANRARLERHDLEMQLPLLLNTSGVDEAVVGNASTFNALEGSAKFGVAAALGAGLLTRSMAVAGQAGRIGGLFGAGRATFQMEFGSTFNESAHWPTADGKPLEDRTRALVAALAATAKTGIELLELKQLLGGWKGFIKSVRGGEAAESIKLMVAKDPKVLALLRRWVANTAKAVVPEGLEEGSQTLVDQGAQTWSTGLPGWDFAQVLEDIQKAGSSVLVIGGVGPALGFAAEATELDAMRRSSRVIQTTAELAKDIDVQNHPELLATVVPEVTRPTGTEVTAWHVDAEQAKKHFQLKAKEENRNLTQVTEEALGPGGEQKLQDALAAGEKVEVPLPQVPAFVRAGAYDALEKDIVAHPAMETPRQVEEAGRAAVTAQAEAIYKQWMEEQGNEEAFQEQMRALEAEYKASGRVESPQATWVASFTRLIARNLAEKQGVNPSQLALAAIKVVRGEELTWKDLGVTEAPEEPRPPAPPAELILRDRFQAQDITTPAGLEARSRDFFIDPTTGLHNARAWQDIHGPKAKQVARISVEGVAYRNNNHGHEEGNGVYRAAARAMLKEPALNNGTLSKVGGDFNFDATGMSQAELDKVLKQASEDAGLQGFQLTGTIASATPEGTAERNAGHANNVRKQEMEKAGQRAPRGQRPLGALSVVAADGTPRPAPLRFDNIAPVEAHPISEAMRQHLLAMPEEDQFNRMHREPGTGLLTLDGFDRAMAFRPRRFVASIDLNLLKAYNFWLTDAGGDQLLAVFGRLMHQLGAEEFLGTHVSGDEYRLAGDDAVAIQRFLDHLVEAVGAEPIEVRYNLNGLEEVAHVPGLSFGQGLAESIDAAETKLLADKQRLAREGKRGLTDAESIQLASENLARGAGQEAARREGEDPFGDAFGPSGGELAGDGSQEAGAGAGGSGEAGGGAGAEAPGVAGGAGGGAEAGHPGDGGLGRHLVAQAKAIVASWARSDTPIEAYALGEALWGEAFYKDHDANGPLLGRAERLLRLARQELAVDNAERPDVAPAIAPTAEQAATTAQDQASYEAQQAAAQERVDEAAQFPDLAELDAAAAEAQERDARELAAVEQEKQHLVDRVVDRYKYLEREGTEASRREPIIGRGTRELRPNELLTIWLGYNGWRAVSKAREGVEAFHTKSARLKDIAAVGARKTAAIAFLDYVENKGPRPDLEAILRGKVEDPEGTARALILAMRKKGIVDPEHGLQDIRDEANNVAAKKPAWQRWKPKKQKKAKGTTTYDKEKLKEQRNNFANTAGGGNQVGPNGKRYQLAARVADAVKRHFAPADGAGIPGVDVAILGETEFDAEARVLRITLNEGADFRTIVHETGHAALYWLQDLASRPEASKEILALWDRTAKWLGAEPGEQLTAAQHEKFAEALDVYVRDGRAPSKATASLFARAASWMAQAWREVRNLIVTDLDDEGRAVLDSLVDTEDAVAAFRKKQGPAMFPTAEAAGVSQAAWDAEHERQKEEADEGSRKLQLRVLKDMVAKRKAFKEANVRLVQALQEEYEQLPGRVAQLWLKKNRKALNEDEVRRVVGGSLMPEGVRLTKDGVSPHAVAEALGFPSGNLLSAALAGLKPKEKWVEEQRQAQVELHHKSILEDLAEKEKMLADGLAGFTERRLLNDLANLRRKDAGVGPAPIAALKEAAARIVANRTLRVLDPARDLSRMRAATTEAFKAAARGQWRKAEEANRRAFLNHYLYQETLKAKDARQRLLDTATRLRTPESRQRLLKASPEGYLRDAVGLVLSRLGLGVADASVSVTALAQAVGVMQGAAVVVGDPDWLEPLTKLMESPLRGYKELTVAQGAMVQEALGQLERTAQARNKALKDAAWVERETAITNGIAEWLTWKRPVEAVANTREYATLGQKLRATPRKFLAPLTKLEEMLSWGGGSLLGQDWRNSWTYLTIVKPLVAATNRQADLYKELIEPIVRAWNEMPATVKASMFDPIDGPGLFPDFQVKDLAVTPPRVRVELLMMALHSGNPGNLSRLLAGRNITMEQLKAALDTLTRDEIEWVNTVGQAFEKLWPQLKALEARDSGRDVKPVQRTPLALKNGTIRGHYFPAATDNRLQPPSPAQANDDVAHILDPNYTRPGVNQSHLKSRVEGYESVLTLSPSTISRYLLQEVHDLCFREPLRSVAQIVYDPRMQMVMRQQLGVERQQQVLQWVKDIGTPHQAEGLARVGGLLELATKLRGNVFVNAMGYSLSNLHEDLSAFLYAPWTPDMKWAPYLKAVLMQFWAGPTSDDPAERQALYEKYGRGPGASIRWVREKSSQMRGMHDTLRLEMTRQVKELSKERIPFGVFRGVELNLGLLDFISEHAFGLIEATFTLTATPGWIAKYEQSLEEFNGDEKRAVDAADSYIRMMWPSHQQVNMAGLLRDRGWLGMTMMFHGWWNTTLQRAIHEGMVIKENPSWKEKGKALGRLWGFWVAAFLGGALLRGRGKDERDKDWTAWATRTMVDGMLSQFPFGAEMTILTNARMQGRWPQYGPRSNGPGAMLYAQALALAEVAAGKKKGEKATESLARALGPAAPVPVAQSIRTLSYLFDVASGHIEAHNAWDFIAGLIYDENPKQPAANPYTILRDIPGVVRQLEAGKSVGEATKHMGQGHRLDHQVPVRDEAGALPGERPLLPTGTDKGGP